MEKNQNSGNPKKERYDRREPMIQNNIKSSILRNFSKNLGQSAAYKVQLPHYILNIQIY